MSEPGKFNEDKEKLKKILKKINAKTSKEDVKKAEEEFKEVLKDANPLAIAAAEGELIKEGYTIDDLMSACDVHLALFKDSIRNPNLKVPKDHPIHRFQEDHKNILYLMESMLDEIKAALKVSDDKKAEVNLLAAEKIAKKLMEAENHNIRQENTLFPALEKHGIEQPPAIMWHEHTEMKEQKKMILNLFEKRESGNSIKTAELLEKIAINLFEKFAAHTQKEENILYVTALNVITDDEWKDIKEECDNLGYFKP